MEHFYVNLNAGIQWVMNIFGIMNNLNNWLRWFKWNRSYIILVLFCISWSIALEMDSHGGKLSESIYFVIYVRLSEIINLNQLSYSPSTWHLIKLLLLTDMALILFMYLLLVRRLNITQNGSNSFFSDILVFPKNLYGD